MVCHQSKITGGKGQAETELALDSCACHTRKADGVERLVHLRPLLVPGN
jgi:hypothetical protein